MRPVYTGRMAYEIMFTDGIGIGRPMPSPSLLASRPAPGLFVTSAGIHLENDAPGTLRAAVGYIVEHWQGRAALPFSAALERPFRLRMRAYAEVFGVQLHDPNESHAGGAFTRAELARLAALCAALRAAYPDAGPARPDNEQGAYARKQPSGEPLAA